MEEIDARDRLEKVNDEIETIAIQVGQLETNVKNLTNKILELSDGLKALNAKVIRNSKTDWGLLSSWAAVMVSVLSMFGYLTMAPINDEIEKLRRWKMAIIAELALIGESGAIQRERIRALERSEFDEPKDQ